MGQKAKSTDFKGGLKELKVYSFRGFINLKPEAAHAVLDLVLDGKLMLTQMKKKAAEVYKLQQVQAALMGVVKDNHGSTCNRDFQTIPAPRRAAIQHVCKCKYVQFF